ncbi:MAG: transcription-repair coupling factor, partial [Chloroflexota bacterium]|nr:transcription-repair coupling factor [Chloroflexota bacterium]
MNLSGLLPLINEIPAYRQLLGSLKLRAAPGFPSHLGLLSSARPYFIATLQRDLARPILVVTGRVERARELHDQLRLWSEASQNVLLFPEPDALPYERAAWAPETIRARLVTLAALSNQHLMRGPQRPVVVASARALMQKTIPPKEFRSGVHTWRCGQPVSPTKMLKELLSLGYEPVSVVTEPGTFSRRGGILDVFSPSSTQPARIEFFGDQVDSLRLFNPATQRSQERASSVTIVPASEALPGRGPLAAKRLHELKGSMAEGFEEDIRALEEGQAFEGIEFHLPYLYPQPATLLDHLPPDGLLIVEDMDALEAAVADLEAKALDMREGLLRTGGPRGLLLPYFTWDELREFLSDRRPLVLGYERLGGEEEDLPLQDTFAPCSRYGGQLKRALKDWREMRRGRLVVVSRQAQRLAELWEEWEGSAAKPVEEITEPPPLGSLTIVRGTLAEGWMLPPAICSLLTDTEIFGWPKPQPRRAPWRRAVTSEAFFADIASGDYVVHIEHGIGIFRGLVRLSIDGTEGEYLQVDYAAGDKLYVPIYQVDRLSRYVGADDRPPPLHRLGTTDWAQVKARAKRAVEEMAQELLELYSAREVIKGHAFSPDAPWQRELEASFPYFETEDQLKAIGEIKADMEKPRPMDRLVCGDVGYGKTEVALRAAFKAVMDGKQVAVLVPTTVLAQQHFNTFYQRLQPFPVEVEMLSRFRSPAEQEGILAGLRAGTVDIVIGTHRLLQPDVALKDLGLLIIDEEQRFGVTHKELLKQKRKEVDVLTLTATPIPRTLYMSLMGARDVSIINTPPEERLPIKTYMGEYDEDLIRKAILRELARGGQVYFVHNRVRSINWMARRLAKLVPEASLAVAHGQMKEEELSQVMLDFAAGKFGLLVCSSIIESGLDIPNVNTIIVNRADRFGLAQLYQLRGRVGRGARRAYAYFIYARPLNEMARKRLETILEASELGAGFSVAMRDLEIRGAGELLGTRQHGHISAIGFDLYSRLLAQAVWELKGEETGGLLGREIDTYLQPLGEGVQISLPLDAYLPQSYVPQGSLRLRLYRRMAGLSTLEEVDNIASELTDRFGDLPRPAENLLYQLRLKVLALQAGVQAIFHKGRRLVIKADGLRGMDRRHLQRRLGDWARVGRRQISLPLDGWRSRLMEVLALLKGSAN